MFNKSVRCLTSDFGVRTGGTDSLAGIGICLTHPPVRCERCPRTRAMCRRANFTRRARRCALCGRARARRRGVSEVKL